MKNKIFIFDIETIIDIESYQRYLGPKVMTDKELIDYCSNNFVKPLFHIPINISYLNGQINIDKHGREEYSIIEIKSASTTINNEKILINRFFSYLKSMTHRLVTFNGRGFDLPVLKYRAMKYNISAQWLHDKTDKWNNYMHRYSEEWHCDLLEVLTDYNASSKIKMSEIASIYNIPCKVGIDGSQVGSLYQENRMSEIQNYCEQDVVCAYLLYLKYVNHTGRITYSTYNTCINELTNLIQVQKKRHLNCFL